MEKSKKKKKENRKCGGRSRGGNLEKAVQDSLIEVAFELTLEGRPLEEEHSRQ